MKSKAVILLAVLCCSCATTAPFSGESHADQQLKADTLKFIKPFLHQRGCETVTHVDVKVFFYEPSDGTKDKVWSREGWAVTACQTPNLFYVTYKSDGVGGTDIQVTPK